jgi:hypothetical protein
MKTNESTNHDLFSDNILQEMEKLSAHKMNLDKNINDASSSGKIDYGSLIMLKRELAHLNARIEQYSKSYELLTSVDSAETILSKFDEVESSYWAEVLGRRAAVELITRNKISTETMEKMSFMPIEDYENAVKICTGYVQLLNDTTIAAESSITNNSFGIHTVKTEK